MSNIDDGAVQPDSGCVFIPIQRTVINPRVDDFLIESADTASGTSELTSRRAIVAFPSGSTCLAAPIAHAPYFLVRVGHRVRGTS